MPAALNPLRVVSIAQVRSAFPALQCVVSLNKRYCGCAGMLAGRLAAMLRCVAAVVCVVMLCAARYARAFSGILLSACSFTDSTAGIAGAWAVSDVFSFRAGYVALACMAVQLLVLGGCWVGSVCRLWTAAFCREQWNREVTARTVQICVQSGFADVAVGSQTTVRHRLQSAAATVHTISR